jgi:hypothetical protein
MVKALGAQRESDGVVVPLNGVRDTPEGRALTLITRVKWVSARA